MKKKLLTKFLAFILAMVLAVPMIATSRPETAYAAAAAMNTTWKTLIMGNTYTFWVKNATNVKSRSWSSSKPSIATVNGKGKVTPLKVGKTTIRCKVTYTNGTSTTLSATLSVKSRIAATSVSVNADLGDINAHTLKVGESFQFKTTKVPSNTTDYAYFKIADEEYASVTSEGVVTAKKAGITMLEVRCGLNETEAKSAGNTATTRVYLYITPGEDQVMPTPTPVLDKPKVTAISLASSKELRIDFSSEILASSVIDSNGDLIPGTVIVTPLSNANSINILTPSLSKDKKTLLLTNGGSFEGTYVITVSENIMTTNNVAISPYTEQKTLKDEVGPSYVSNSMDETGYVSTIHFSEPIDISNMSIYSVNGTTNTSLQSYLTQASNYILSADKKSLSINLSSCGVTKANVLVYMVGIKDVAGNSSNPFTLSAVVEIDATQKPNATIVSVTRTSKNIVTATFTRSIQYAGYMYIGSDYVTGVVDSNDSTKVNYTIPNPSITGSQVVTLNGWISYNAISGQTSDVKRGVDFTLDTTAPVLIKSELSSTIENKIPVTKLTLTYNKEVILISGSGTLSTKITTASANVYNKTLAYTAVAKGTQVTLSFTNQAAETGTYYFEIPASLVMDKNENMSIATNISLSKQTDNSTALPAPVSITQDPKNPSKLYVKFNQKLDMPSAQNIANYTVGTSSRPTSALVIEQNDTSATVELTFASGVIASTTNYPVTIRGIKGYNDSYSEMNAYNTFLPLVENSAPTYVNTKLTSAYTMVASFTENFSGTGTIEVYNGNVLVTSNYVINGNELYISLDQPITGAAYIMFTKNEFTDVNNNKANVILNRKIAVTKAY